MTDRSSDPSGNPQTRELALARLLWIVLALVYFGVYFAAFPSGYAAYGGICGGDDCLPYQLTEHELELLQGLGFSPEFYAGFFGYSELLLLTWAALGVLIFVRRSNDWIGLLVSMALIAIGINGVSDNVSFLAQRSPDLAPLYNLLGAVGAALVVLLFFLFPDGRYVPPWSRYLAVPLAALALVDPLLVTIMPPMQSAPGTVAQLAALLSGLAIGGITQIHRYRNYSNLEQRQQTKWVLLGFLGLMLVALLWTISTQLYPPSPGPGRLYFYLVGLPIALLVLLVLPISMTFSILRYRLFDIDVIIKRTLTYGALSILIVATYFAAVVALQGVFRALTGQTNQLAIVASTLLIAALFNPLRRRIQEAVNRRFFRGDYDAAQTLNSLGQSVRDEVDLDRMQSELLSIVEQTMHPSHASLWLKAQAGPPAEER